MFAAVSLPPSTDMIGSSVPWTTTVGTLMVLSLARRSNEQAEGRHRVMSGDARPIVGAFHGAVNQVPNSFFVGWIFRAGENPS